MQPPGHHAPLDYHRALLADTERMSAWDRAIRTLVHPGMKVLDAGAGTGVLGMLAARRGARVIAVESAAVAGLARTLAANNGLQIDVRQGDLATMPPERVDLVLCDLIGRFVPDEALLGLVRAAGRWSSTFVPRQVRLFVAPIGGVQMPEIDRFRAPLLGLDLSAGIAYALNTAYRSQVPSSAVLCPPVRAGTLTPPRLPDDLEVEATFEVTRNAELRGFAGWFESQLADGIVLDTRPGRVTFWGQTIWPVAPVNVQVGDVVHLSLDARSEGGVHFAWAGRVERFGESVASWGLESDQRLGSRGVSTTPIVSGRPTAIKSNEVGSEALLHGELALAVDQLSLATRALTPEDDDIAPAVFENLGLALYNAGRPAEALDAFLRALDGRPTRREQALQFAIGCLAHLGRQEEARSMLKAYEDAFGAHPFVKR